MPTKVRSKEPHGHQYTAGQTSSRAGSAFDTPPFRCKDQRKPARGDTRPRGPWCLFRTGEQTMPEPEAMPVDEPFDQLPPAALDGDVVLPAVLGLSHGEERALF